MAKKKKEVEAPEVQEAPKPKKAEKVTVLTTALIQKESDGTPESFHALEKKYGVSWKVIRRVYRGVGDYAL